MSYNSEMGLKKLDTLDLVTTQGLCQIELLAGDITLMTEKDTVDICLVSTLPRSFSIRNEPIMKALRSNMNVLIDDLWREMEKDLRKNYHCWLSKPLPSHLPFRRLVCFEKQADSKNPSTSIRNIFRGLMPIFDFRDRTVAMNLLGTWNQHFDRVQVLNMTVNAACNWMKVGLQLRCLKIVLCETDTKNNFINNEECIEEFERLKEKWTISKSLRRFNKKYDVYISYSQQDAKKAEALVSSLTQANENLKIFYQPKSKFTKPWPEDAMLKIYGCKRFLALLTSYYLKSKDCIDEFFTAICYQREIQDLKVIPLYMETFQSLPPIIRNIPFSDCRLARNENLADKFSAVCDDVTKNLTITKLKRKHHSDHHNRQYDIHISYPDKYWKEVETVYKVLKRHNPNLNIFYDKMVLKRGSNWTHSIYKALEEIRCCIILVCPAYFEAVMCKEEFNVVVARRLFEESKKDMAVIPICVSDVESIPDWFGKVNIIDARGSNFHTTIEMLSAKLKLSFKNNTLQEDFDWLMEQEINKNKSFKGELRHYRRHQFCTRFFEHEAMVIPRELPGNFASPCNILVCFSTYDRRIAGLLIDILLKEMPWIHVMLLNKPNKDSFYQLNKADHIVMFVCEDYLSSPKGLEILSICLKRQRKSDRRILHFACTSLIPNCLSYLQILPYSVLFTDQIWGDMRKRYPEKGVMRVTVRGVNGKFACEKFEYMALEKLAHDIMFSEQFGCSSPDELENLVPILKISQEGKQEELTLKELLIPCPREFQNLCCLQESLIEQN